MQRVDALIRPRWTVRVEPQVHVEERLAVAVDDGRIVAVLPVDEADRTFVAGARHDRPQHVLLPGLVNAHTHAAQSLLRGLASDLPSARALERVGRAEARWLGTEFVADGARLAIAEMLLGGITCFADMYPHADVVAEVASESGVRAVLGLVVREVAADSSRDGNTDLHKGLELRDRLKGDPRIRSTFAPWSANHASDATLARIRQLADELDAPVHTQLHETDAEIAASVARFGLRPLERLRRHGLVTPSLIAAHANRLEPSEIAALATAGASVVHCARANLKLANGACPVADLLRAGVNVALGTAGAASSDRVDLWAEMQTAALLAKHVAADAAVVPAAAALAMATINGARALGLDGEIGSLVAGKAADLICVDLGHLELQPVLDPLTRLVYAASSRDVTDVWVAGEHVVTSSALLRLDGEAIAAAAAGWGRRLGAGDG
ncbi:MAG TPA: amidohydrolase family protein [Gammaproteobacteria bacterium]|nr:amidohydrolase family protein [Gammaproteobacteria bacterium]